MKNRSKTSSFCLHLQKLTLPNPMLPCLLIFFEYLAISVTGDSQLTPFHPIEDIKIDCGSSSSDQTLDGRIWTKDGLFSPMEQSSVPSTAQEPLPPDVDDVPFSTARLSHSEFTYSIPLTAGPKFVRFHFYPTSYQGFDDPSSTKAFFSVKAGHFTLLGNFSALLHAQGQPTVVKEFFVNINESQRLNITFTPSLDILDSYAFINGIEIVSMPLDLYHGSTVNEYGITFLGQSQGILYTLGNDSAMEKLYRVNIGGIRPITGREDTGMYRYWEDDSNYLVMEYPRPALPFNYSIDLNFIKIPSYSAPREVYATARSMGPNKTHNENYSLTWEFSVDSGFYYFVRLHFCEFQIEITMVGDRVFEILIANLTAATRADVIAWSGGRGIPIYRDYVVAIGAKGNLKQQNLSIALHPAPAWRTFYSDAILNGIEIFKISHANFNLAGPNPDPIPNRLENMKPPIGESGKNKPPIGQSGKNRKTIVSIVVPISCFVAISLLSLLVYRSFFNKIANKNSPSLPSDVCRHFSLREIKAATNNFDQNFIIGRGGFGDVYKGFINAGSTIVAIKRLNPCSKQGVVEFKTEIETLSQLRHQNLVSLIGYCEDRNEMILVYDYMVNGTLRDHLYNTDNPPLPWNLRLKMCIGAAYGLNYLHKGPNHSIIHRDVKTANILLSEKWVAKVSDFGLSKMNDMSNTHISTAVKGSFGYLDLEYFRLQQLSEKSDVYSFGVVLCEILCARAPIDRTRDHMEISLADWAKHCYDNGTLDQTIDPYLEGKISTQSLLKFGEVAINCLAAEGSKRPAMSEVVCGLELALQLQEINEVNPISDESHLHDSTVNDYHVLFTSGSGSMNVGR